MNDSSKQITNLEDFLYGSNEQPLDDVLSSLRQAGIDTDKLGSRVIDMVNNKRREQLQQLPSRENRVSSTLPQFLTDVRSMPHELLFAAFDKLCDGELGEDLQEAAKARISSNDSEGISDEELRSWLEEIANSQRDSDGGS